MTTPDPIHTSKWVSQTGWSLFHRILPYAGDLGMFAGIPTLYVNVPAAVIHDTLQEHGGMVQGKLSHIEEYDQDGYACD